jgi:hypothetical protein
MLGGFGGIGLFGECGSDTLNRVFGLSGILGKAPRAYQVFFLNGGASRV